jgi:23S rRNA (pseudouridine1915-N3)-methyltransferase
MRIVLLAAANRQPAWVDEGYREYARRLRGGLRLELIEVPLARRSARGSSARAVAAEGERMLAQVPRDAQLVALAESGRLWRTRELAGRLASWISLGHPVCLAIGGPDGLAPACLERAREQWSLSPLTLPHGLARILVAEALYRAWSVLENHPYHRA